MTALIDILNGNKVWNDFNFEKSGVMDDRMIEKGVTKETRQVPVSELVQYEVDPRMQRAFEYLRAIGYLKKGFNPLLTRNPVIFERADGSKKIGDGQHTASMLAKVYGVDSDTLVEITVIRFPDQLSEREVSQFEAEYYITTNMNVATLKKQALLKAGLIFDNPESVYCYNLMQKVGIIVDDFGCEGGMPVVTAPRLWSAMGWKEGKDDGYYAAMEKRFLEGVAKYREIWPNQDRLYAGILEGLIRWLEVCDGYLGQAKGKLVKEKFTTLGSPGSMGQMAVPSVLHKTVGSGVSGYKTIVANAINQYDNFFLQSNLPPTFGIGAGDRKSIASAGLTDLDLLR